MAKSLAKINEQIAKLQKEADSIQSTVIARIKREIAQHGLTSEHLFGAAGGSGAAGSAKGASKVAKTGSAKPAKYADGQGNTWHGIGKRPQWIHEVLNAGQSLADFLVGAKKARPAAKVAGKAPKKRIASKKVTPVKRVAKSTKAAVPAKVVKTTRAASKAPAKKAAKPAAAKKSPVKGAPKAKAAASPADAVQASN